MKVRSGFVSNSSSSSFVILGIEIAENSQKVDDYQWICETFLDNEIFKDELNKQIKKYGEDGVEWADIWYNYMNQSDIDIIHENKQILIGKLIATSSDSEIDNGDISLEEMIQMREKLKEIVPNVTDKDFRLFYGSYYC